MVELMIHRARGKGKKTQQVGLRISLAVLMFCAAIFIASGPATAGYSFVREWTGTGAGFNMPDGITLDGSGNVYVVDTENSRIQKFNSIGTFMLEWGSAGFGQGEFSTPRGVAVDGSGNVYVADQYNFRIQKFDFTGNYLLEWPSNASSVAVDGSGNVFVNDLVTEKIQKYNSSGTFITEWGGTGNGDGQFSSPYGIAVDGSGNVYVADTANTRVQKFDNTGTYLTQWETIDVENSYLVTPAGITVDATGNVYVVSFELIQKYAGNGDLLVQWGGAGEFDALSDIAVVGDGTNVYVTDSANNRVEQFGWGEFVNVSVEGMGSGAISSNVGGVAFGYPTDNSGTTSSLTTGTEVVLTATADSGSVAVWSDCVAQGGVTGGTPDVATCTITANSSYDFNLLFLQPGVMYVAENYYGFTESGWDWIPGMTSGDCSSWDTPCDLQYALTIAPAGSEIWVSYGTYYPTSGTDRNASFVLKNGVALYGGFNTYTYVREERDFKAGPTILSGDIGVTGTDTDNSYHVVTAGGGVDNSALLDGFTITKGNSGSGNGGGGYFSGTSSPTLSNLTFSDNSAGLGGGIYTATATPVLGDVIFSGNTATSGGGWYCSGPVSSSNLNVSFIGNTATSGGGAYFDANTPDSTLVNVTFSGNSATSGGGIYTDSSVLTLLNSTMIDNTATVAGGAVYMGARVDLTASILWGNIPEQISGPDMSKLQVSDNIIQGGCPAGASCVNVSPADPQLGPVGDYGGVTPTIPLLAGSPAVNAFIGPLSGSCPATDQRGVARPQGPQCDLGAYEFVPATTTSVTSSPTFPDYGDPATWTATVTDSEVLSSPAGGTMTFSVDGGVIPSCIDVPVTGDSAECTLSTLEHADFHVYMITAEYSGEANFSGSVSAGRPHIVPKADQTITVTTPAPATAIYGADFLVTATGGGTGNPVTIVGSGGCIGSGDDSATITMTSGSDDCTVTYDQAGGSNYNAASQVSETVTAGKAASTTDVVTSITPAWEGRSVTFTATVPGDATGTVIFTEGVTTFCVGAIVVAGGQAQCSSAALTLGAHIITATYSGDNNYKGSSGTVDQSVIMNDSDSDGVLDGSDNCPGIANFDQADADLDNVGDVCDAWPNDNGRSESVPGWAISLAVSNQTTRQSASVQKFTSDGITQSVGEASNSLAGANLPVNSSTSYVVEPNGTLTIGVVSISDGFVNDNGVAVSNNVRNVNNLSTTVKFNTGSGMSDVTLTGKYYFAEMTLGEGWAANGIGDMTFDGSGNWISTSVFSKSDVGANLPDSDSGTYTVGSDGNLAFTTTDPDDFDGAIESLGDLFIAANVSDQTEQGIYYGIRAGVPGSYSNASLNGVYHSTSLTFNFTGPWSQLMRIIFDGNGNFTVQLTYSNTTEVNQPKSLSGTYSVNSDGTFTVDASGEITNGAISADNNYLILARIDDVVVQGTSFAVKDTRDNDTDGVPDSIDACLGFDDSIDADNDGAPDNCDAFPTDPAASIDADGDGHPDAWNPGMDVTDSNSGLTLDICLGGDDGGVDSDGDGMPDACDAWPNDGTRIDSKPGWAVSLGIANQSVRTSSSVKKMNSAGLSESLGTSSNSYAGPNLPVDDYSTLVAEPDGILIITSSDGGVVTDGFFTTEGVAVFSSVRDVNRMSSGVKFDTDTGTSEATLSGRYFFAELTQGDGWNTSSIGSMDFNGTGNWNSLSTFSETGIGANQQDTNSGSYAVNDDGSFSFVTTDPTTWTGGIEKSGDAFIAANVSELAEQGVVYGIRAGLPGSYSTSSLSGTFYGTAFTINGGGAISEFHRMTFDGLGNFTTDITYSDYTMPNQTMNFTGIYTVNGDGTFAIDVGGEVTNGAMSADGQYLIFSRINNVGIQSITFAAKDDRLDPHAVLPATDLNEDGTPDNDQPDQMQSVQTEINNTMIQVGLEIGGTTNITAVTSLQLVEAVTLPAAPVALPVGLVAFTVNVTTPGATAEISLYYGEPLPASVTSLYKYDVTNGWYDFTVTGGMVISSDRKKITYSVTDGGIGDSDGVTNGVIVDPVAPAVDGPYLVKDINFTGKGKVSSPSSIVEMNGVLFFTGNDFPSGSELRKSDGTDAGTVLVKDIQPGSSSGSPTYLTNVNGTLFFTANDGVHGQELWKSDGTEAGTVLVKDIYPGTTASSMNYLTDVNGILFFIANDGVNGTELWKSDGTAAGTVMVKDIYSASGNSNPQLLVNVNGTLFFRANDGVNGTELWKSDGTLAGTVMVIDNLSSVSPPAYLTEVGGLLYFTANDNSAYGSGTELWRSDGTAAGTYMVKDINPGTGSSSPKYLINVNGTLYFNAYSPVFGQELMKSDGTSAGTVVVKDIGQIYPNSNPENLTNVNGTIFFRVNDGVNGIELWKSDGTEVGTVLVKDIYPGSGNNSNVYPLGSVGDVFYFRAEDGTHGAELWRSDGTELGTEMLADIYPGAGTSGAYYFTSLNGTGFFSASDGVSTELWKTDGTPAGTQKALNIIPGLNSSYSGFMTNKEGTGYFRANDGIHGYELWKSDGTEPGTVMLKDIFPGLDGSSPAYFALLGNTLYFVASDGVTGSELWKTDGTSEGTLLVKDIYVGAFSSSPTQLTVMNGLLYFSANNGTQGNELWKSDGTAAGTVLVKDIYSGSSSSSPLYFTNVDGTLFFSALNAYGRELWKSDGTTAGTVLVKDIYASSSSSPSYLTDVNGTLFFSADNGTNGRELWKSDGTDSGTVMVKDIQEGLFAANVSYLYNFNGTLYFSADDGVNGAELWKSDGTDSGTVIFKDINPGVESSNPANMAGVNGILFFGANDGIHGQELWQSDGTSQGMKLTLDIYSGLSGSNPSSLSPVDRTLFFSAFGETSGYELWAYDTNNRPTFNGTPAITGLPEVGITLGLTGTATDDLDDDTVTLSYLWQVAGVDVENVVATYTPVLADIGKTLTCTITADDGFGGVTQSMTAGVVVLTNDTDGDGVINSLDAFPNDPDESADADGDGVGDNGDLCPGSNDNADADLDNVPDGCDAFPNDPTETIDSDGDGAGDNGDVCFADLPIRVGGTNYWDGGLQHVYDNSVVVESFAIIKLHSSFVFGQLELDLEKDITLQGGYDCGYIDNSGLPAIIQSLTIGSSVGDPSGSVTVDNISIE